jgi:hypothetical protein
MTMMTSTLSMSILCLVLLLTPALVLAQAGILADRWHIYGPPKIIFRPTIAALPSWIALEYSVSQSVSVSDNLQVEVFEGTACGGPLAKSWKTQIESSEPPMLPPSDKQTFRLVLEPDLQVPIVCVRLGLHNTSDDGGDEVEANLQEAVIELSSFEQAKVHVRSIFQPGVGGSLY